jgi:HEPN domain-containing protein
MSTDSYDVKKWIRFAQMDFDSAVALSERFRPPLEIICYLCQQAAEKILKAYIIAKTNTLAQKTHYLKDLLKTCVPYCADFDKFRIICDKLTPYITVTRYPSIVEPTEQDMKQALKDAESVLEFTKSKLKEMGYE